MKDAQFTVLMFLALCWSNCSAAATAAEDIARAQPVPLAPADERSADDDIIVTAPRRGEAEVAAETEFSEEEIASHGADSINELLERLSPLIDGSGEEPVILVNGKDIGFDRSILGYPPEALERLAVLKAEAAARYGHRAGRRVVNLVLKKNYASRHAEAASNWATRGGQYGGDLTIGQVAISGPVRWNAQARVSFESALRNSARGAPSVTSDPVDTTGYVAPLTGNEIDPALSGLVGEIVAAAAVPVTATVRPPGLTDFMAGAGRTHPAAPAQFETLRPSRRRLSLNLGASRPLGPFDASLSVSASSNHSERRRGLPMASVVLPQGSPWSPFSADVLLVRPFAGDRALRSETSSKALNLSLTLTGSLGSWRTTFSASYARTWADNYLERGIDASLVQGLIEGGDAAFNPYGPWPGRVLLTTASKSDSEVAAARFNAARPVLELPAGPVTANFSADASRSSSGYRRFESRSPTAQWDTNVRRQVGGELSFSIPVSRNGDGPLAPLGELTLDLAIGGKSATGSALRKQYGGSFTWSPSPPVQLVGSWESREVVPSSDDLGAPRVETVTRIYDFVRQEVAEPLWITGGNPLLHRGSRQNLSLDVKVRPFDTSALAVSVGYRQDSGEGGIAPFPELTPTIEAAFPGRVVRDSAGRLQTVDARPINIAGTRSAELVSSVVLRLPAPGSSAGEGRQPAMNPLRFSLSLNHTWRLKNELLTRPGVPVIDQLAETGQSRHYLSLQATAGKKGIGGDLRATWSSPARVVSRDSSSVGRNFRYEPPLAVNAGLFVVPDQLWARAEGIDWLENLKVSLEVENLLDTYRRVTLSDGSVPPGFSRHEVDPLGRTVELSVRKRF